MQWEPQFELDLFTMKASHVKSGICPQNMGKEMDMYENEQRLYP